MKTPKRKSVLQERRTAADVGGREQPGSGAPEFYKGDVRKAGELRIECKTTGSKAFPLKLAELEKIKGEALMGGDPAWAMQVEFQGQFTNKKFAVIDWHDFLELHELRKQHERAMKSAGEYMSSMAKSDAEAEKAKYE